MLLRYRPDQPSILHGSSLCGMRDRAEHRDLADVEPQVLQLCELEGRAQQPLDLEIRVDRGAAVQLRADLDRLARRAGRGGGPVEHAGPKTKEGDAPSGEEMGGSSRPPGRYVGADAPRGARG